MKTVIVAGHTSGLGFAVTKALISKKYKVIGIARSISSLKSDLLVNTQVDLSKKEGIEKAILEIKNKYSQFDCIVYCAGTLTAHDVDSLNYDDMEQLYKVSVFAPMMFESNLLSLIRKNGADVVNITSSALIEYYPKFAEYSSAKAAFQKFTKDLQQELRESSARVIEFCPGAFASNIYKNMTGEKVYRNEAAQLPADDYASIIVYLLELPKKIEVPYIYVNKK